MRCILCCSHCTFGDGKLRERSSVHARLGHLQRFECGSCKAMLCRKPRFVWMGKQQSCFSLFHAVSKEELAILSQNLCSVPNPTETAFASMVVVNPQFQERRAQRSQKMKLVWQNRKTCCAEACAMAAIYNMSGLVPKFCATHKLTGMVNVLEEKREVPTLKRHYNRRGCAFEGCETYASFNYEGRQPTFCKSHKLEGMERVKTAKSSTAEIEPRKRGPYKKRAATSNANKTPDVLRAVAPAKTTSSIEVDINSPAVERIGKRGKKSQPITGAKKALKVLRTTSVVATNAYTGKRVVIPGLKRSALAGQQVAPGGMQPSTLAMVSNSAFLCTSDGCAASACYGYEQMNGQPDKCSAHRLEGMVPMV